MGASAHNLRNNGPSSFIEVAQQAASLTSPDGGSSALERDAADEGQSRKGSLNDSCRIFLESLEGEEPVEAGASMCLDGFGCTHQHRNASLASSDSSAKAPESPSSSSAKAPDSHAKGGMVLKEIVRALQCHKCGASPLKKGQEFAIRLKVCFGCTNLLCGGCSCCPDTPGAGAREVRAVSSLVNALVSLRTQPRSSDLSATSAAHELGLCPHTPAGQSPAQGRVQYRCA